VKKYESQVPACVGKAIESCLAQTGFKKIRSEKTKAGVVESVYEKSNKTGRAKLWVPENSKEPFPSKMVIESNDGLIVTTRFSDPKEQTLDEKLFSVPSGYHKSSGLSSLIR
jgi:outer membrane lipoprotein-sorting protein